MLHFHFCQKYTEKVSREVDISVRKRIKNLETRDSLKGVSGLFSYNGVYVLQTNTPLPMRTIIQEDKVTVKGDELSVYFVQDIVLKDELEPYVEVRKGLWSSYYPVSKADKDQFINSFTQNTNEDIDVKNPLPDHLSSWLTGYRIQIDYDIYESKEWVAFAAGNGKGMREEDITAFRELFYDVIVPGGLKDGVETLYKGQNTLLESKVSKSDLGIIYSIIEINNKKVFFLHGGAHVARQSDLWMSVKQNAPRIDYYDNIDAISRAAERAYPSWVLKKQNAELWKNIQRISEGGNLALLTEQTEFLDKFRFPSYIDGQAGSGKSTMLYYLFANAFYYKCLGEIKGDLIFLTENGALLENTKRAIRDILKNNPAYELGDDYIINLDNCFSTLKDFLHSQLDKESQDKFPIEKYLDFSIFKEKFENATHLRRQIKEKFTPEFVWFVVTTYVKGHDLQYEISSENYDDKMPSEGKDLISKDDLKQLEKHILPFYLNLTTDDDYWDKVKIIRYLKEKIGNHKLYEVIFCDEAQDFGRIELQFIVNLSEYLQYNLDSLISGGIQGVPIVFAGDPFQTVNPTGFRKAEVKDLFFIELKTRLDENQYKPTYNYRSSQAIVNLSNSIQFFRKERFSIKGKPQKTKRPQETGGEYLDKFISFEVLSDQVDHYIEQLKYKTIIIPIDSGNKDEYIQKDEFLRRFIAQHAIKEFSESNNDSIIRTAVEAKGVDYPQVIVHGFGKYCLDNFGEYGEIENNYDAHFFFNKLYVAVTRAQEELIIIDSDETFNQFWQLLLNDYAISEWQRESGVEKEEIINSICLIKKDNVSIIKQGTRESEKEVAKREKEQALYKNDTDLMRMAASRFAKIGEYKDYYLCKAEEAKIKGDFERAVEFYLNKHVGIEGFELAATTYWEAGELKKYQDLILSPKNEAQELRKIISSLFTDGEISSEDVRKLEKKSLEIEEILRNVIWKKIIFEKFAVFATTVSDVALINILIELFKKINTSDNTKLLYETGHLQFRRGFFAEAIETWNKIEGIEEKDERYIKAQIEVNKQAKHFDVAIEWLGQLSELIQEKEKIENEIISLYELNSEQIDKADRGLAYLYIAGAYLIQIPTASNLIDLFVKAEKSLSSKVKTLTNYYSILLSSGRLTETTFGFILERWAKYKFVDNATLEEINSDYKSFIHSDTLEYPFTLKDIQDISSEPLSIEPKLPEHIHTITILNFRKFKDVTIEQLGLFNLVVGDNNIGKTSLLEALLFTSNKKDYLRRLGFAYIERKNVQPDKHEINGRFNMTYSLNKEILNDFKNQDDASFCVRFILKNGRNTWKYLVLDNDNEENDHSFHTQKFDSNDYVILKELPVEDALQQPFMPYGKGFGIDLAVTYSDEIAPNIDLERQFLNHLDLFIPNTERVRSDSRKGDIFVLIKGYNKEIPLHQFGEGANKLFRILLLLTLHKGKRVMIDEIDAGIHYSRFKEFWKIILEVAMRNNTQIITTTHNEECIAYYTEALRELGEEYEEKARVVQCKIVNNSLKIRSYDFNNFNFAQESGIELRGGDKI